MEQGSRWRRWRAVGMAAGVAAMFALAACGGGDSSNGGVAVVTAPETAATAALPTSVPAPAVTASTAAPPAQTALAGVVVQAGDSIGIGEGASYWAAIDHMALGTGVAIVNVSVSGRTLLTGYDERATELFPNLDPTRSSVLLIEQGTNDLGTGTAANDLYATLAAFVADAHAAGFYVVVDTLLPRDDSHWSPAKEQQRQRYNKAVRANAAGADAISDLAADAVIGDAQDPAGSVYFTDALHPSLAGQQRMAVLDEVALRPWLALGPRSR